MEIFTRPAFALGFFVFAMMLIPLNDSLIKLLSSSMSIFQVLAMRAFFSLCIIFCVPGTFQSVRNLRASSWAKLLLRGFCLVGAMLFFFLPLASLTLAEVTAIFYVSPLLISLLSVPFLGEKLGIYRLSAVVIGLVGVMVIVRPGGEGFQWPYLLAVVSASSYAAFQIITRYIRQEANVPTMVAVQNIVYFSTGLTGMAVIFLLQPGPSESEIIGFLSRAWFTPDVIAVSFLAVAAAINVNLAFASTNVYKNVEATYVAPFEYVALPMAVVFGIVILGDWPDINTWFGMALIIAGGIFMIYRENIRDRSVASSVPMRAAATNTENQPEIQFKGGETEGL